jgi:16S rRNA processing protein RimM
VRAVEIYDFRLRREAAVTLATSGDGEGVAEFSKEAIQARDYCVAKGAGPLADRPDPSPRKSARSRMTRQTELLPGGDFITLARVVKAQGRHGEVAAEVRSDVPDRFREGMKLLALPPDSDAGRRELEIEDLWPHKGLLVLKFRGIDSISQSEALVGSELQLPSERRAHLEPGWNYVSDLVGCAVFDRGREIGRIESVQFGAGEAPLLVVVAGRHEQHEIPFAEAYLEAVDLEQKQVRMRLPEGMLEVNAPISEEEKRQQAGAPGKKKPRRVR